MNPEITVLTEHTSTMMEGCLSIEGMRGRVARPNKVRIEALDRHGEPKAYELEGFPAVVVQHECDHLDGVLYVDRCDPRTLAFLPEYRRFGPVDEWFEEQKLDGADPTEPPDEALHEEPATDEVRQLPPLRAVPDEDLPELQLDGGR